MPLLAFLDQTNTMLLHTLKNWAPFHIDALGIVTLLGADEMDLAVGRLSRNRYTENLPLLGSYIVANNAIRKPKLGFTIYNITDGIMATDVTPWFARWLLCAKLSYCHSTLVISTASKPGKVSRPAQLAPLAIAVVITGSLLLLAAVTNDWWGFANGISMLVSVVVRRLIVAELCQAIDIQLESVFQDPPDMVKCFCTLPDGTSLTLITQRKLVVNCLLTEPRPPNRRLFEHARTWGWIAFSCHVITLGMACLFNQILSVVVMLLSTILVARNFGDDEIRIGSRLELRLLESKIPGFRSAAYARLGLDAKEEASMRQWNMFPHESNDFWWSQYRKYQRGDVTPPT
ncbi:hypothetical protein LTR17_012867 [Elasticomyces elasticus]|nr:hypothetical protein LTR17_012867 [Elasticomyces elasticus]